MFFSRHEFSHEKCSEIFPDFFKPLFCGFEKIPQNSHQISRQISLTGPDAPLVRSFGQDRHRTEHPLWSGLVRTGKPLSGRHLRGFGQDRHQDHQDGQTPWSGPDGKPLSGRHLRDFVQDQHQDHQHGQTPWSGPDQAAPLWSGLVRTGKPPSLETPPRGQHRQGPPQNKKNSPTSFCRSAGRKRKP